MLAVGIKILKNKLSEYVRRAAAGEIVLITDRDRVVAELVPPAGGRAERVADAELAALVKNGLVRAPFLVSQEPPPRFDIRVPLAQLLTELESDRAER